jgi:hypothetical protein
MLMPVRVLSPVFLVMSKCKHHTGIGGLNPNPESMKAIHISAVANPSTITTSYTLHDQPKDKKPWTKAPSTSLNDIAPEPKPQTPK